MNKKTCKNKEKEQRFISPLDDTTFKFLWKRESSRKWYIKLIKLLTNIDLSEYSLYDPELNSGNEIKDYIMDILFMKEDTRETVNVEMYSGYKEANKVKSRYYGFRLLSNYMKKGEEYVKYTLTQVNFYNGYYEKDKNVGIVVSRIKDDKDNVAENYLNIYDVYLLNYKGLCYNDSNELEAMLSFLTGDSYEELRRIASGNEEALEIVRDLEDLMMEEKYIGVYDRNKENIIMQNTLYKEGIQVGMQEGREQGKKEGLEQGKKDGAKEEKYAIAKKLIEKGMAIEEISLITDLTIKDLERL